MKLLVAGPAVAALITLAGHSTPATAADVSLPYSEAFTGATTEPGDWLMVSPRGDHVPCLTAGTTAYDPAAKPSDTSLPGCAPSNPGAVADAAGEGVFQLTSDSQQDAGALILNQALNARQGIRVEFDQYQFGPTPTGADG